MSSLKEQIANTPDLFTKTFTFAIDKKEFTSTIRRLTITQRDEALKDSTGLSDKTDQEKFVKGSDITCKMVLMGVVEDGLTMEDIKAMPSVVVERIAKEIMTFNGWNVEGQRLLDDNFRPTN